MLAAASVVFWGLRMAPLETRQGLSAAQTPVQTATASSLTPSPAHLERAWGASAPQPASGQLPASRFQLRGVVASASGRGSALIAVDGQPPRAFRVGQTVADGLVLQSLGPKMAQLGASAPGAAWVTLSLPDPPKTP